MDINTLTTLSKLLKDPSNKDLTEMLKDLYGSASNQPHTEETPLVVGDAYFFRTVTYHYIGVVEEIKGDFVSLTTASWVCTGGRFTDFLTDYTKSEPEIEPYPNGVTVNLKSIVDFSEWTQSLPTKQIP